jgi:hypothetical protein
MYARSDVTDGFSCRYANERHSYSFPRIVGVLGDGKTKYDFGNDGDAQAIGACSVSNYPHIGGIHIHVVE